MNNVTKVWGSPMAQQFAEVLLTIDDIQTMQNFLRDVMTEKEIVEISSRLEAARMLQAGSTYTGVVAKTKLSSRTVARIGEWLKNGCSGYEATLKTVSQHHVHMSPVRAE